MILKAGASFTEFVRQRGVVRELDPRIANIAIQGHTDEIAPAAKADEAFYRQFRCPRCHSEMGKEFVGGPKGAGVTWVEGAVTPQALLRCLECALLLNPRSGMIIETGKMK